MRATCSFVTGTGGPIGGEDLGLLLRSHCRLVEDGTDFTDANVASASSAESATRRLALGASANPQARLEGDQCRSPSGMARSCDVASATGTLGDRVSGMRPDQTGQPRSSGSSLGGPV